MLQSVYIEASETLLLFYCSPILFLRVLLGAARQKTKLVHVGGRVMVVQVAKLLKLFRIKALFYAGKVKTDTLVSADFEAWSESDTTRGSFICV